MDANDLKERLFPRLKAQNAAPPMTSTTSSSSSSLLPPIPADDEVEDERRISPFPYSESEDIALPEDYRPTKFDVINGRGRKSYNHIANRRFRQLISMNLGRYQEARCKVDKTLVVVGIVNTIRRSSPCGGFIKRCPKNNRWISMSDEAAREKVGHCLRDMIASQREEKKRNELQAANNANIGPTAKAIEVANLAVNAAVKKKLPGDTGNKRTFKSQSPVDRAKREKSTEGIVGASAWLGETTENELTEDRMPSLQRQSSQSQQPQHSNDDAQEQQQMQQHQQHQQHQQQLHQHDGGVMWQNPFHNNEAAALHAVASFPAAMVFPPMMHAAAAAAAAHHAAAAAAAAVAANSGGRPPHPHPILGMQVPLSFSNIDAVSLQKGNLQDMSEQQRKILMKLEGGWKGSVELLLKESE